MAAPYHHAVSSVKKWGGAVEDYLPIHEWFDATKEMHGDFRHRALRHHAQGIFECERQFGTTITLHENGKQIPVKWVAEQHVIEDLGRIPSLGEWLSAIQPAEWMTRSRKLSQELEDAAQPKEPVSPALVGAMNRAFGPSGY
jgi:hypothetical protein